MIPQLGKQQRHINLYLTAVAFYIFFTFSGSGNAVTNDRRIDSVFDLDKTPKFQTRRGRTFRALIGDTIVLPCPVNHLGQYMILWKKSTAVLSAGDLKVSVDPRIQLAEDYSLEIRQVRINDAGKYTCQINTLIPQDQTQTLEILVPPSIRTEPNGGQVFITKGDTMTLQCRANGNPKPNIRWTRVNDLPLPNGEEFSEGNNLDIEKADKPHSGAYICTASNGVGTPVSTTIHVKVQYPPEIHIEKSWINVGVGQDVELICDVIADPPASVYWHFGGKFVHTTQRHLIESRGERHLFLIRRIETSDFGNYSCEAENKLGRITGQIEIQGIPNQVIFRSDPQGNDPHSYNMSWITESASHIIEYQLLYRKSDGNTNETGGHDGDAPGNASSSWNDVILPNEEESSIPGNFITQPPALPSLGDIFLPASPTPIIHVKSYQIRNLEPQTLYEARLIARNKFGVSRPSQLFMFRTSANTTEVVEIPTESEFESETTADAPPAAQGDGPNPRNDLFTDPEFEGFDVLINSGAYICTASNGVGTPVSTTIHVKVQYPPEIHIEKSWINVGVGQDVELICDVIADPPASVYWHFGGKFVHTTQRHLIESRGERHLFLIRRIETSDFGNYSCEAENKLGRITGQIEIQGIPNQVIFRSDPQGNDPHSYNMSWITESASHIIEYQLLYRKSDGNTNETGGHDGDAPGNASSSWNDVILPNEEESSIPGNFITQPPALPSLGDIFLPASPTPIIHVKSYQIRNLEPQTLYEARLIARNKFGVSRPSQLFMFRTSANTTEVVEIPTESEFESETTADAPPAAQGDGPNPRNDLFTDPEFEGFDVLINSAASESTILHSSPLVFVTMLRILLEDFNNCWK